MGLTTELRILSESETLVTRLSRVLAGGVGSNDRGLVHPHPVLMDRGSGSHLIDVDGNEYVDYLLGYGPLVLGHAHPRLVEAVSAQLARGSMYGVGHRLELEAAELLAATVPSIEMVRFSQSGTEATLAAMRLARAATGRRLVVKFEGHYHGWLDQVAVSYAPEEGEAGPADAPSVTGMSQGQSPSALDEVAVLGWNDLEAVKKLFAERGDEIAAVLTEPIMCNFGVIDPLPGYLEGLRDLCHENESLLVFDEVQTGFRVALGGAQELLGVTPDITCLGKALSGGFPVSAIGGRADIMELIADKRVFHAGTYNSNPVSLAAIPVVIDELSQPGVYDRMASLSLRLRTGIAELVEPVGGYVQGTSTMFGVAFGHGPGDHMRARWHDDFERVFDIKRELRLRGVWTKPTPRDIWYVSTAHSDEDVEFTLQAAREAVAALI